MLSCPATIPLSSRTLNHLAERIRGHRKQRGSRWRRLEPGRQALLALTHLRNTALRRMKMAQGDPSDDNNCVSYHANYFADGFEVGVHVWEYWGDNTANDVWAYGVA